MEFILEETEVRVKEEPTHTSTQGQFQIDLNPDWQLDGNEECTLDRIQNICSETLPSSESQLRWRTFCDTEMGEGQDETNTRREQTEEFRTQTLSIDEEIDIKYEESGFEYDSETNAEGDHDIDPDPDSILSNINPKPGTQCPINSGQFELSEFYLGLLQCEQDCETCQKYIRKLSEHIRITHGAGQPTSDPLDIDKSPAVEIKCEVDEDIERMDYSEKLDSNVESVVETSSESEPDYTISHDSNSQRKSGRKVEEESDSDPDYNVVSGSENDPDYITPGEIRSTESSRKETFTTAKRSLTGKMPSKIRFKCTICEKSFSWKGHLDCHMRIHTGEKPYKSNECDKSFKSKSELTGHTGERPLKCTELEKSFPEKGNLDYHLKRRTQEKLFKCDLCLKGFTRKSYLQIHLKSHSQKVHRGENPFRCTECGKNFTLKCNLDVHMRCHIGEKPFKCTECGKSFSLKGNLDVHMRCHTGEKPFKCTECEKRFSRKDVLDGHLRSHTGEKPFKCDICLKDFAAKSYLKIHLRSHSQKGLLESEKTTR